MCRYYVSFSIFVILNMFLIVLALVCCVIFCQLLLKTKKYCLQFHWHTSTCNVLFYPLPSARQHPIYGNWSLRGNIIRTALCWIVWHNVHSQQHTYMSSSYRSGRLGLSHWDPYAVRRGGCLDLYYCNMMSGSGGIQVRSWRLTGLMVTYNLLTGTLSNQPTSHCDIDP